MRYKDEYEVARLHAAPEFRERLDRLFDGALHTEFPPRAAHPAGEKTDDGEPKKKKFGGWMMTGFRLLRHFKFLRGTFFDPFGHGADRKLERRLIEDYRGWIEELLPRLGAVDYATAVAIAALPEEIRGYGPVKERHLEAALARREQLLAVLDAPAVRAA